MSPRSVRSPIFSQSPSTPSPLSPVSSRNPSALRSPSNKVFSFACRHEPSRLSLSLMRFQMTTQALGTKKCYDCQTSTSIGALILIKAMNLAPDLDKLDPKIVKQAAQLLFERLAGQRRSIDKGFKGQWGDIELAFATFCYRHIPVEQLSDLCQTIRTTFGAGVDRQLLRALAEAAFRENKVWDYFDESTIYNTLNHYIEKLRQVIEQIDRFSQVRDMFLNAEALGHLATQTVSILEGVDSRLSHNPR
ncbi:hypothetical protein F5Y09DRAFT_352150 [Xylaria sp. FL1042]|nr:hypothetical protein F5Y09DRAFT_352150 [Xylaria sp. FL1042]